MKTLSASHELLFKQVTAAIEDQPVTDLHTHCFSPRFGASPDAKGLLLWGIDDLLTYHYLIAEVYRVVPDTTLAYEQFWAMPRQAQADHIWKHLFVESTPVSEACRGVLTTLSKLGLDPNEKTLTGYRQWFKQQDPDKYVDKVMELSHVDQITMTNEVFDDQERTMWEQNPDLGDDPRFKAVLRIDKLLVDWSGACADLKAQGYDVKADFSGETAAQVKRFLEHWLDRMKAIYVAVSLPPEFKFPDPENEICNRLIRECLMPVLADRKLPWALMMGVRRSDRVNPLLRGAGDMVGRSDVFSVVSLCSEFRHNKFMVTMLARENQHDLCVAARKFGNLMIFGCWWFLNNPSLIEEMTQMRLELLGTSFVPQHSDARILDQLIYKWDHTRTALAPVLADQYAKIAATGYHVTPQRIKQDVALLQRDNFHAFLKR